MQCEIAKQFFEMIDAINSDQKIPKDYGTGHLLYHAELDLLEKISLYPNANVSALSAHAGVTKSAITQICTKLLEKGLIEKYSNDKNKKEKYFRLTPAGENVRDLHQQDHDAAASEILEYLCSLKGNEKTLILSFMQNMKKWMPLCAFPCMCGFDGQNTGNTCELIFEKGSEKE
jgi:Transcriptional regulators